MQACIYKKSGELKRINSELIDARIVIEEKDGIILELDEKVKDLSNIKKAPKNEISCWRPASERLDAVK